MPVSIIAPLFVEDDSVLSKRHPDFAISDVQCEQGNGSCPWNMENQPFGRCGLDVEGEVRSYAREEHNSAVKMIDKMKKMKKDLSADC